MKSSSPAHDALAAEYKRRYESVLQRLAANLGVHIGECLKGTPRVDRISARAKSIDRFLQKAMKAGDDGCEKYDDPLNQIQDQIGARIVVFYESDVERTNVIVNKYFTPIESRKLLPEREAEFGYFGQHFVLVMPSDVVESDMDKSLIPAFFELQVKTLFQHAWSEAEHDLGYKPGDDPLSAEQKRLIAFTAAQAWGADHMFERLFSERGIAA
jgi:putative GTP pyrophosphokinase